MANAKGGTMDPKLNDDTTLNTGRDDSQTECEEGPAKQRRQIEFERHWLAFQRYCDQKPK